MTTGAELAERTENLPDPPPENVTPDARAEAQQSAAALRSLLEPVRTRIRVAQILQVIASAATVIPFIGIVELGRTLLGDGAVDTGRVWLIVWVVTAGLGARAFFSGLALAVTHFADVDLQAILRRRITAKLSRLPLGWFTRTTSGQVRKATQHDVGELHYLVAHADVETTAAAATPLFALIYCFVLDWRLGLLAVATLPLYAIAYAWMVKDSTEQMAKMNAALARISSTIVEFVSGVSVVKTFGQTGRAHKAFVDAADEFNDDFAGYVGPMLRIEALSMLMLSAPLVLLVNLGGGYWFVRSGSVDPIEVLGSTLVALILPATLLTVSMAMYSRREAAAAAQRLVELFDLPELEISTTPSVPQGNTVEFLDVSFAYPGDAAAAEVRALESVSATLHPGTVTALVGPSGSGKSTLATLLPRFADPDEGAVMIGGVDVRDIAPEELYRHVGFVLQDVALLGVSVADNIRLGRPEAGLDEVIAAARTANIDDRIRQLPNGYDAIADVDAHFSGGEAQRISIARALLSDAPILVLDEATAFADPDSEAQIQEAVARLMVGRTVLVIAHRLGSITHADNIIVLDGGRVVETGIHAELAGGDGLYASMWRAYLGGTSHRDEEIAGKGVSE
ncbi:ABC transporter ATP-binding protein [Gordonia sp. ABSL11-1]|uniref:ABC transporter ATP-binding protein n=1 Tax=Gordonia sp. ABSL11-1 TaxID=3053924 RepID=UPI0025741BF4|nr:ABC transporter ATP-binding protein [Gordonia sp. ABSL11-1]MDL9945264.1 ABC transporter ATP-binding protein [Gordonia sp. ABSL11-1]